MKVERLETLRVAKGFVWEDHRRRHVVLCGDGAKSRSVGKVLEGRTIDLALLDPSYDLSRDSKEIKVEGRKNLGFREVWDVHDSEEQFWDKDLQPLLDVVAGRAANVWCWTSDWWLSMIKRYLRKHGYRLHPSFQWCKTNPAYPFRKRNLTSAVEYLAMASIGSDAWFHLKAFPFHGNWHSRAVVSQGERLKLDGEDVNKAQKPLDLVTTLVKAGCPKGGTVVDLTGGSGTTLIAADRLGRRCVLVEREPLQVELAIRRLLDDRSARRANSGK